MIILGIETTCDETGVGIVRDGQEILSNIVASSALMHRKYGGIVPEVAAREQVKVIVPTIDEALQQAQVKLSDIDAIAVANGPGLVGSLLVGVETAKVLAIVWEKPLIAVNHLIAHVYANWLNGNKKLEKSRSLSRGGNFKHPAFPLIALIVSGGHTDLILMTDHNSYRWLGGTLDDACGEAFDKVARVLGLGYPGGPEIERAALQLTTDNLQLTSNFPRPMISDNNFDFSFSGLKTAVVNYVGQLSSIRRAQDDPEYVEGSDVKDQMSAIAAEFQNAVCDVLVSKTLKAARKFNVKSIVVGGGVAANSELRRRMSYLGREQDVSVFFPPKNLSVDNGAMIATAGFFQKKPTYPLAISANPGLYF